MGVLSRRIYYRARYSLACWISIALVIHSFDPIRSVDPTLGRGIATWRSLLQ